MKLGGLAPDNGVTDGGQWVEPPPGKLNVKTGPPIVDILIFSILLFVEFVVFEFVEVFFFNLVWTSATSRDSLSFLNVFLSFD